MAKTDTFFNSCGYALASDADLSGDLLELAAVMMTGFYVEILEMNQGDYLLQISRHDETAWNMDLDPSTWKLRDQIVYRFETREACIAGFAAFNAAAI